MVNAYTFIFFHFIKLLLTHINPVFSFPSVAFSPSPFPPLPFIILLTMKLYYLACFILSSVSDADDCTDAGGTWTGYTSGGCGSNEIQLASRSNTRSWFGGPTAECCKPATCGGGGGNQGNGICPGPHGTLMGNAVNPNPDRCCNRVSEKNQVLVLDFRYLFIFLC